MNFPVVCVDNFYSDPDKIRKFALSLEYHKIPGNYPGFRTNPIYEIQNEFFQDFCYKLFSLFFNYDKEFVNWKVESYFQKIYPYSQDKNSPLNSGWYHIDSHENIAAGIIYLNPHSDLDSGTTIGSIKPNFEINQNDFEWRNKLYSDSVLDLNQYQHKIIDHNLKFEKTLEFKNVYNRMVMYDADYWHKESNFYINDCEPRLTQVFFINKIESESGTPMQRMNGAYI